MPHGPTWTAPRSNPRRPTRNLDHFLVNSNKGAYITECLDFSKSAILDHAVIVATISIKNNNNEISYNNLPDIGKVELPVEVNSDEWNYLISQLPTGVSLISSITPSLCASYRKKTKYFNILKRGCLKLAIQEATDYRDYLVKNSTSYVKQLEIPGAIWSTILIGFFYTLLFFGFTLLFFCACLGFIALPPVSSFIFLPYVFFFVRNLIFGFFSLTYVLFFHFSCVYASAFSFHAYHCQRGNLYCTGGKTNKKFAIAIPSTRCFTANSWSNAL